MEQNPKNSQTNIHHSNTHVMIIFLHLNMCIVFLVKALAVIAAIQQNILIHISSNLSE
jgi:hypothetical protein